MDDFNALFTSGKFNRMEIWSEKQYILPVICQIQVVGDFGFRPRPGPRLGAFGIQIWLHEQNSYKLHAN